MSKYIVMKFGGSSQCADGMNVILRNIINCASQNYKLVLVISAVGKTTNNLYGIINCDTSKYQVIYDTHKDLCSSIGINFEPIEKLLNNLKLDMEAYIAEPFTDITQKKLKIISYGEYMSSLVVHNFLKSKNISNKYLNSHLFMKNKSASTTIDNDSLNIKGEFYCDSEVLLKLFEENVIVTQGFISSTSDNKCCVLTRSGSNTSASLIASALNAERLEIWTDVSGLYTADPRKIKLAKIIPHIKYSVCQEAAAMGSQVIHPFSIKPCEKKNIPIHIKNTFRSDEVGTIISDNYNGTSNIHLVSCQENVTVFKITSLDMWEGYGFVQEIFSVFKDECIDVNIITTSQFEITTTTNEKSLKKIARVKEELSKKYKVDVINQCVIVSVIADKVSHNKEITKIHESVINEINDNIYITHFGSNNMTLSYVIDKIHSDKLTKLLHQELIENVRTT